MKGIVHIGSCVAEGYKHDRLVAKVKFCCKLS